MADEAVNGARTQKEVLVDIEKKVDRAAEDSAEAKELSKEANAGVLRLTRLLLGDKLDPQDVGAIGEIRQALKAAEGSRLKRRELVAAWSAGVLSFLVGLGLIITSLIHG